MKKLSNKRSIIFFCIRHKHPDWSNKRIAYCTRYAYRNQLEVHK
nr:MAG TPA: hypothetical protein [Caudoviricetes sp.]